MSGPRILLDSFSGQAADLPPGQRTAENVLEVLKSHPRVSCWDMGETAWLRSCIGDLLASGRIRSDPAEPYPWIRYIVVPDPLPIPLLKGDKT